MGTHSTFGAWLKSRLKEIGKTQRWLAQAADIPETTLSDLIKDKITLSAEVADKLSRVKELGASAAMMLEKAGKIELSEEEELDEEAGLLSRWYANLSPQGRSLTKEFILMLLGKEQQSRNKGDSSGSSDRKGKRP